MGSNDLSLRALDSLWALPAPAKASPTEPRPCHRELQGPCQALPAPLGTCWPSPAPWLGRPSFRAALSPLGLGAPGRANRGGAISEDGPGWATVTTTNNRIKSPSLAHHLATEGWVAEPC